MIASLRGKLLDRSASGLVIEAAGVGYAVSVSTHTLAELPSEGADVFLRTRQVVREDALLLFGFLEEDELKLFDLLLSVSGVGPRVALAVLSGLAARALVRAIREESIAALVAIPGIGRKTAERLVVELRDKMDAFAPSAASGAASIAGARAGSVLPRGEKFEDAVAALTRLGYTAPQAQDVLRRVSEGHEELALESLVKRALALLARPQAPVR
ncbi:MAG: Holliday junction branch migration protein RuvA [Candidatus Eiseniibacteriota bacterium]